VDAVCEYIQEHLKAMNTTETRARQLCVLQATSLEYTSQVCHLADQIRWHKHLNSKFLRRTSIRAQVCGATQASIIGLALCVQGPRAMDLTRPATHKLAVLRR
jgi:hypothetical protein